MEEINALPTIEDVLKKHPHISEVFKGDDANVTMRLGDLKSLVKEWASLTPSNEKYGWVKASERLPDLTQYSEPELHFRFDGKKVCGVQFMSDGFEVKTLSIYNGFYNDQLHRLEWLDESTPIPLTPCGWVRVEDGLPETIEKVLTFEIDEFGDERIGISTYTEDGDWYAPFKTRINVKYWMPLPTKPNL